MPNRGAKRQSAAVGVSGSVFSASRALPSEFVAAGNGTDPRLWNMVLQQDGDGYICEPRLEKTKRCAPTRVLDRPVYWEWGGEVEPAEAEAVGERAVA